MKHKTSLLCSLFLLISCLYVSGQVDTSRQSIEREQLDYQHIKPSKEKDTKQIISASRSLKDIADIPYTVFVVEGEEIRANHYITLADVLKTVPGIKVSQPGSVWEGETFLMRGLIGNTHAKILVNNVPVQPSVTGFFPIASQLPIQQAERIEIVYGPATSLYGEGAMAGVINIITKDPEESLQAQADVRVGQFGNNYFNFFAGGKLGKDDNILQFSVYGNRHGRDDLNIWRGHEENYNPLLYQGLFGVDSTTITNRQTFFQEAGVPLYRGTLTDPIHRSLPQESQLLGLQLSFKGARITYDQMRRNTHSSVGRNPLLISYANPNVSLGENIQRLTAQYSTGRENFNSRTNLSYLRMRLDPISAYSTNYNINHRAGISYLYAASDDLFLEQLFTFQLWEKWELLTGVSGGFSGNYAGSNELEDPFEESNYRIFSLKQPPEDDLFEDFGQNPIRFGNAATFGQIFYRSKRLVFIGGVRADVKFSSGQPYTGIHPRVAVLYPLNKGRSISISAGTAMSAPAV